MKSTSSPDILHFQFSCPLCRWKGEVTIPTHFGSDRGRDLHLGDCLFNCGKRQEPRHLYFLEMFSCPGCSVEDESSFLVAEIHCLGNRWVAIEAYPAQELVAAESRV
jgi:hypothetical protein